MTPPMSEEGAALLAKVEAHTADAERRNEANEAEFNRKQSEIEEWDGEIMCGLLSGQPLDLLTEIGHAYWYEEKYDPA